MCDEMSSASLVSSLLRADTGQYGTSPRIALDQLRAYEPAPSGRVDGTTQIYEGTNQIQRIVIAKKLLG